MADIELATLKTAINAILDHLMEDLRLEKVTISDAEDLYWACSPPELYDMSRKPTLEEIGRLSDDLSFMRLVERGHTADASYNLIHVAPLLRYIAEKVKQ